MDVFSLRNRLINDYAAYVQSFIHLFLDTHQLNLTSRAQVLMSGFETRPDFVYDDQKTVVYVDGPIHDYPKRAERDARQRESFEDFGYKVIVFRHQDDWRETISRFPSVFGNMKEV